MFLKLSYLDLFNITQSVDNEFLIKFQEIKALFAQGLNLNLKFELKFKCFSFCF
jgi:hypothetical protein